MNVRGAVGLVGVLTLGPAAPSRGEALSELLATEGVEYAYPRFSRDGSSILLQSNASGRWRLCILAREGGHPVPITADSTSCYFADWSPDGDRICFVSDRTGSEEIYTMASDGSHERSLTDNGARNIHPYWSPDGQAIFFSSTLSGRGDLDVYRIAPDGTGLEVVLDTPNHETCARMSPDGSRLTLLMNNEKGLDDLFLLSLADSSLSNVTNTPTLDGWPCWSPDGAHIVFSAVEDDVFKLFRYDIGAQRFERLTDPELPYDDCRPDMARDGSIVFNRQHVSSKGKTNAIWILGPRAVTDSGRMKHGSE